MWVRPGAYSRVDHLKDASLGYPPNIRLGWKGMPGTNTLAFYENSKITAVKKVFSESIFMSERKNFLVELILLSGRLENFIKISLHPLHNKLERFDTAPPHSA